MAATKDKSRMAGEYLKSFNDHHDTYTRPKSDKRRADAQEAMGTGYEKNIDQYDYSAYGRKSFDQKDVDHLKSVGYSDKQISNYTQGLEADQLSKSLKYGNDQFSGKHGVGGMEEGADIGSHDMGKYIQSADIKYLKKQGYDKQAIADHIHSTVTGEPGSVKHGKGVAKFMNKHGYLDYYQGEWKSQGGKPDSPSEGSDEATTTQPPSSSNPEETPATLPIPDESDGTTPGTPSMPGFTDGMYQNVNQDNDITTNIDGDNNTVDNQQENSIRQYGGRDYDVRLANSLKDKYILNLIKRWYHGI